MSPAPSPRSRRWRAVVVLALGLTLSVASACTGDEGAGTSTTADTAGPSSSTGDNPLQFTAYVDPAAPITAAIGERFALLLDAEPSQGLHWEIVEEADREVVLPLGSQFLPRDRAEAASTTSTTAAPAPPTDPVTPTDPVSPTDPASPTDTETPTSTSTTTTTVPTRSLQVLSYVGRAPGTTTVVLRYVGVASTAVEERTVTFTIQVVDPLAPPPPSDEPVDGAGPPAPPG